MIGRTTEFLKSVVIRVSEARDLARRGKRVDRYDFYEHCKTLLATPPDVLRVNEKYVREYYIVNVIAVAITSNHRNALYLPHDDRRHRVVDSTCKKPRTSATTHGGSNIGTTTTAATDWRTSRRTYTP